MEYIYSFKCKLCHTDFQESRSTPYKSVRRVKLCADCKTSARRTKMANELGGHGCDDRCETCVFFSHYTKSPVFPKEWGDKGNGWGVCAKLRYADEFEKLVYKDDACVEFQRRMDED